MNVTRCGDYSPAYLSSRTAAYTINAVLGLPVCCYIMRLIVTGSAGTPSSELFTVNLLLSELLACVGCVFNALFTLTHTLWIIPLCVFFDFFFYFSRPLLLTLISVERYLAVLEPVLFLRCRPLRYRLGLCAAVWTFVCLFSISYVLSIATDLGYYGVMVFYLLIVAAMMFCCVSVLGALTRSGPGGASGVRNRRKRKAFNLTLINTSVPLSYVIYTVATPFYRHFKYTECFVFLSVVSSLTVLFGFIHPLLYLRRWRKLPCTKND